MMPGGLSQDFLYLFAAPDQFWDAEAAFSGRFLLPASQSSDLCKGKHDVVLTTHDGHHRVLFQRR